MINKIELRNKIFLGIKLAIEDLIKLRAKENDFLIVSKKGKIVKIPAKDLVKNKI